MPQLIGHSLALTRIGGLVGDPTLTVDYDFLLNSGTAITGATKKGPDFTFTRASDAGSFLSTGVFALVGANDLPRFTHDPADSNAQLGLLMEEVRTNLCLQSSTFGTTWSVGALNVDIPTTNNSDIFGTTTADEIATTNTADEAYAVFQDLAGLTANVVTSCSVHVKTGTNVSFVQLAWDDTGGGADGLFCNFQLTGAGTAGTVTALAAGGDTLKASIELTTDGFYRCVIVGEIDIGTAGRFTISMVDRIDAVVFEAADLADNDSIIVCAADIQVGSFMTSHIPTTTASVTRAKDVCITTDMGWVNEAAGTAISNIYPVVKQTGNQQTVWMISGGNSNNSIFLYFHETSDDFIPRIIASTSTKMAPSLGSPILNAVNKTAFAWTENDGEFAVGGVSLGTDTDITPLPASLTEFHIGNSSDGEVQQFNSYIQSFKYYNVRKPAAFLVSETT